MGNAIATKADRRDHASRHQLVERIRAEFDEMPCLRLTAAQVRRLFDLKPEVCDRVLAALVRDKTLWVASDNRCTRRPPHIG